MIDYDELVEELLANEEFLSKVAERIEASEIAGQIQESDIAAYIQESDIADYISIDEIAEHVDVSDIADCFDVSDIAECFGKDQLKSIAENIEANKLSDYVMDPWSLMVAPPAKKGMSDA